MNYLLIFFQSNFLEMPVYLPFLMNGRQLRNDTLTAITLVTAMNAITHPIVFFYIMNLKGSFLLNILMAETFAVVIESILLWKIVRGNFPGCLFASLCANFFSWQVSPMLTYALYSP